MISINKWDIGIVNDPYFKGEGASRACTNFDCLTNPSKMTPYRSSEDSDAAATTSQKQNFCIGYWTPSGGSYRLFSLGVVSGTGRAEILMKELSDLADNSWDTPANNQSSTGSTNFELFIYYKTTGKIYGARSNRYIWEFTPDGATVWDDSKYDYGSTFTNISNAIIHSKDDIMYFGIDNKIMKNDSGTFSVAVTLPTNLYITSVCEYGNYLAVATAPLSGVGNSVVYLWDRDSTLETLSEVIDFGTGVLKVLDVVDGVLIGISLYGSSSITFKDKIYFRAYTSTGAVKIAELNGTTSSTLSIAKQLVNNRLYFLANIVLNGTQREGVWSIGRAGVGKPFAIFNDRTSVNDTALSSGVLKGFIIVGDYTFISSVSAGGSYQLYKTDDQANYTSTAIFETTINPNMPESDLSKYKQLKYVSLSYEPLPTAGQVVLEYRVEGGSWTTIFTETDNSKVVTEATAQSDDEQFSPARNYEFRIESTGGAEIVQLTYHYEVIKTQI